MQTQNDTRESLIKELADEKYAEMEESCVQGGVKFDKEEAMRFAIHEATLFVNKCILVGMASPILIDNQT